MSSIARYNNIEYFMPFLFCNDIYIPILNKLLENEKNPIKYVYGCPLTPWGGGGRPTKFNIKNLNQIEIYLKKLKNKNVIPTFTFTNTNTKEILNDEFSNELLDIAYQYDSRFIVATDDLYNHIKSRYKEAKMHCSVVSAMVKKADDKNFNETDYYNKMLDKYEVVVLRPEYTMENIDNLDTIISDISRVEVLVNQYCVYNCHYQKEHNMLISEYDRLNAAGDISKIKEHKYYKEGAVEWFSLCPKNHKKQTEYKSVHFSQEQYQQIIDIGVKKIKLQGRSYDFDTLYGELYEYFFNKEFSKDEIRNKIDLICAQMIQNNAKMALFY